MKSESVTGEDGIENPPMRVDITDSRPPSRAIHTTSNTTFYMYTVTYMNVYTMYIVVYGSATYMCNECIYNVHI